MIDRYIKNLIKRIDEVNKNYSNDDIEALNALSNAAVALKKLLDSGAYHENRSVKLKGATND